MTAIYVASLLERILNTNEIM